MLVGSIIHTKFIAMVITMRNNPLCYKEISNNFGISIRYQEEEKKSTIWKRKNVVVNCDKVDKFLVVFGFKLLHIN